MNFEISSGRAQSHFMSSTKFFFDYDYVFVYSFLVRIVDNIYLSSLKVQNQV